MQPNVSRPVKQVDEKRSKWRLFGKGTNKNAERQIEPGQRSSDASATSNESHRSSGAEEDRTLINGSRNDKSPRETHPVILATQYSGIAADRRSNSGPLTNGTLHNISRKDIHPGLMATQSGITIEKVFHPQSVLSSSSTPSVRQETFTDPITGEMTTKTITTVVTETTTTQVIKPPVSQLDDDLDVEEERRLAAEYLATSELRSTRGPSHGLRPPPRPRGSLTQDGTPSATPIYAAVNTVASPPRRHSPQQETTDPRPSDCHPSASHSCDRFSFGNANRKSQLGADRVSSTQTVEYTAHNDRHREPLTPNEIKRKQQTEISIHAQSSYGNEPARYPAANDEPHHANIVVPIKTRPQHFHVGREDRIVQPEVVEGQAETARVRSAEPAHTLTPPPEEQKKKKDTIPNKRESWATLDNALGTKIKPNSILWDQAQPQPEHAIYDAKIGPASGNNARSAEHTVAKTISAEQAMNGERSGWRP